MRTLNLVRSIDSGDIVEDDVKELAKLAKLNKVLLGFLRRVGYGGSLRVREENLYKWYMSEAARVSKALSNLNYALFKFRKPIEHVSVDIDVLVLYEHLPKAVKKLAEAGFRIEVLEPYTVTMVRGEAIVDLYTHPSFAWITYLDGLRLLKEVEVIEIGDTGVEARALSLEAEVVATVTHAIYKEHVYLLLDYYTVKKWTNRRTLDLAEELNAGEALELSLKINEQIERGVVETPLKLNPAQVASILSKKFAKDPYFRSTTLNLLKLLSRRRAVQQLIWRITRKTY